MYSGFTLQRQKNIFIFSCKKKAWWSSLSPICLKMCPVGRDVGEKMVRRGNWCSGHSPQWRRVATSCRFKERESFTFETIWSRAKRKRCWRKAWGHWKIFAKEIRWVKTTWSMWNILRELETTFWGGRSTDAVSWILRSSPAQRGFEFAPSQKRSGLSIIPIAQPRSRCRKPPWLSTIFPSCRNRKRFAERLNQ